MRLTPWRKQAELARDLPGTGPLRLFRDEMDRLFDSFFGGAPWGPSGLSSAGAWSPDLELSETDKEFVIRAEMPGLEPKDIDISITGNVLTLSGEKKEESEEKKGGYYRSERRFGSFCRRLELPPGTKSESVSAEFDKGLLTLKIAKDETAASKRVEIKTGSKTDQPEKQPKK